MEKKGKRKDFFKRLKRLILASISLFIMTCLVLQAVASFRILCPPKSLTSLSSFRILCAPSLWPFLDYPMYAQAHYKGERINQFLVLGVLEDSTEVRILPADLGLHYWLFQGFISALRRGENKKVIKDYIKLYEGIYNKKLIGLRLENHPLILSREGLIPDTVQVIKDIRLDLPGRGMK